MHGLALVEQAAALHLQSYREAVLTSEPLLKVCSELCRYPHLPVRWLGKPGIQHKLCLNPPVPTHALSRNFDMAIMRRTQSATRITTSMVIGVSNILHPLVNIPPGQRAIFLQQLAQPTTSQ